MRVSGVFLDLCEERLTEVAPRTLGSGVTPEEGRGKETEALGTKLVLAILGL